MTRAGTSPKTPWGDPWFPGLYGRFSSERSRPFYDLLALCAVVEGGRALDLGCGSGVLTTLLHDRLEPGRTTGFDSSPAMLAEAARIASRAVDFELRDIAEVGERAGDEEAFDVVASNTALQWVRRDHREVLASWRRALRPGGQLAVQVPRNADHLSHLTLAGVAHEEPFLERPLHLSAALSRRGRSQCHRLVA